MNYYCYVGAILLISVAISFGNGSVLKSFVDSKRVAALFNEPTTWGKWRVDGEEDWKRARMYFEGKPEVNEVKGGTQSGRQPTPPPSQQQELYVIDPVFGWNSGWNGGWSELGLFVKKTTCGWTGGATPSTATATLGLQPSFKVDYTTVTTTSTEISTAPLPTLVITAPTQYITPGLTTETSYITLSITDSGAPTQTLTSVSNVPLYTSTAVVTESSTSYLCTSTETSYSTTITSPSATEFYSTCDQFCFQRFCDVSTSTTTVYLTQTIIHPSSTDTRTVSLTVGTVTSTSIVHNPRAVTTTLIVTESNPVPALREVTVTSTADAATAVVVETMTLSLLPSSASGGSTQLTTIQNGCTITKVKTLTSTSTFYPTSNTVTSTSTPVVLTAQTVVETIAVLETTPLSTLTSYVTNPIPAVYTSTQTIPVQMPEATTTTVPGDVTTVYDGITTLQLVKTVVVQSVETTTLIPTSLVTEMEIVTMSTGLPVQTTHINVEIIFVPLEVTVFTDTSVITITPTLTATATQLELAVGCTTWDGGWSNGPHPQQQKAPSSSSPHSSSSSVAAPPEMWRYSADEEGASTFDSSEREAMIGSVASPGQLELEPSIQTGLSDDVVPDRFTISSSGSGWDHRQPTPALASSLAS